MSVLRLTSGVNKIKLTTSITPRLVLCASNVNSSASSVIWGNITGTLSNQTDLQSALNAKQTASANLTSLSGLSYVSTSFVKMTGANTFALDTNTYLTGNQTITLGGILSGSGTTSITASAASGYYMPTTTDQTNWNTAYSDRLKWDGGSTGLTPLIGRNSLELGTTSTPQFSQLGLGRANVGSYSLSLNGSLWINAAQAINWAGGNASIEESSYALLFKTYTGSSLTEKMRIAGDGAVQINNTLAIGGATLGTNALAVTGGKLFSGGITGGTGIINSTFDNPADTDQWIKLRSGLTGDTRNYLAWFDYQGTQWNWLMGRNASNVFVLFDALGANHRMVLAPSGSSYLNSGGTTPVIINGATAEGADAGSGGLYVQSGGASPYNYSTITANGITVNSGDILLTPRTDIGSSIVLTGGLTTSKTAYLYFTDYGNYKWFMGKHNSDNDFVIYNYGTSSYNMLIKQSTGEVLIGTSTATGGSTKLTVNGDQAISGTLASTGLVTLQKADSGGQTDLLINPSAKASGRFADFQINNVSKWYVNFNGSSLQYGALTIAINGIGTTIANGLTASSYSAATVGAPVQNSSTLKLLSYAWNTTSSASKANAIDLLLKPTSGAATSGDFVIQNNTLDGTANTTQLFKINMTTGTATITGSVISASVAPIAGTTSVAPIVLTSGTNLSTPQSGAFEFDGTNLYFTI